MLKIKRLSIGGQGPKEPTWYIGTLKVAGSDKEIWIENGSKVNLKKTVNSDYSILTVNPSSFRIFRYTSTSVYVPSKTAHLPSLCTFQAIFSAWDSL